MSSSESCTCIAENYELHCHSRAVTVVIIHTRDIVCMPVLLQAVEMYTDLRQFDMAKQYLSPSGGRGGGGGGGGE